MRRSGGVGEHDGTTLARARFEEIYDRHYPAVVQYVRFRVRPDRVDDVVAETFLTAWRRIDTIPCGDSARWWLLRVAYRVVGHQWRGRSRRNRLDAKLAVLPEPPPRTPEDEVVGTDDLRRVLEALAHLGDDDAEILRLATWDGLGRADIAQILDVSPEVVSQRLHRARARLTKQFDRLEGRDDRTPAARKGGTP